MKQSQILVLLLFLAIGNGIHAALPKEKHWLEYNNPYNDQLFEDNDQLQFRGDSFWQYINQEGEDRNTPLNRAIRKNDTQKATRLIELGAEIDLQNDYGLTPLHWAVHHYNISVIRSLIEAGADVNKKSIQGNTPLHFATDRSADETIQLLVAAGADETITNNGNITARDSITSPITRATFNEVLKLRNQSLYEALKKITIDANVDDSDCLHHKRRKS